MFLYKKEANILFHSNSAERMTVKSLTHHMHWNIDSFCKQDKLKKKGVVLTTQ